MSLIHELYGSQFMFFFKVCNSGILKLIYFYKEEEILKNQESFDMSKIPFLGPVNF